MLQDRFVKIMLVVIAGLLAMNLVKPSASLVATPAMAQGSNVDVVSVKGYNVVGLKDVVSLGDGKSFVVSAPDKFMVYQVTK